jgi:uridine kinase
MNPHEKAASKIAPEIIENIKSKNRPYIITLAGESGCGKTETGKALVNELRKSALEAIVLGQDNYFFLPPIANDTKRKSNPSWLGPRKEVNLELMEKNLIEAINGEAEIKVPHIEYNTNVETTRRVNIQNIKVIIAEGTYTSLLKNVDTRIFIDANYKDTLKYRKQRNRGSEVNDPFVESILETEHKIIAGHIFLADFIITKNYEVIKR